ncbi:putative UDP-arabinose 4-epimerase 3 [Hibiscus syriacus]|uniref:UDP-arabinose 4-epimerase 3 n=1 Tax=Hibiscus syriacus TaxID=106335 RepID=A0A6A3CRJ1_HIBSY|nr:putative UDP-arabinose 4-epimerase 3 [Hibiscus syriacus]
MWDLNDSPYQQPRDNESEGCCSSQKTSVDGNEDKGKWVGSMSNSSSSALVVEDGSEEEDGERVKAGLKKRSSRIFDFSVPHEEEEEATWRINRLPYYHNITSNTLVVLESMAAHGVRTLIYSSTCATYGEPEKMPITEETPQAHMLRMVKGMDYKTHDGTSIRDYINVTDLVDAHMKALQNAKPHKVGIYNVGTGRGRSVKEFVEACKKATGVKIKIDYLPRRPGDYAEVLSDPTKIRRELN